MAQTNGIQNILFDWSGTVSDDFDLVYKATMQVFTTIGIDQISKQQFREDFTLPYMDFYSKYTNTPKEVLDPIFIAAINTVGDPRPYPGAGLALAKLDERGVRMAVLSSHNQPKLEQEIRAYGFQRFFVGVSGSVYDKRKTILDVMQEHGFATEHTAYVGDMTHDIEAGKAAGIVTVAVTEGYQSRGKLLKHNPDHDIPDISHLEQKLWAA